MRETAREQQYLDTLARRLSSNGALRVTTTAVLPILIVKFH
jgi:hypothetical protein